MWENESPRISVIRTDLRPALQKWYAIEGMIASGNRNSEGVLKDREKRAGGRRIWSVHPIKFLSKELPNK